MTELLDFVNSCLNADEAIANEVSGRYEDEPGPGVWVHDDDCWHDSLTVTKRAVLATVAAHRAILAIHEPTEGGSCDHCSDGYSGGWPRAFPCPTVRALVSAYSGRSGYQADWAPT